MQGNGQLVRLGAIKISTGRNVSFLPALLLSKAFTEFVTAESVRAQMPKMNRETLFAYKFPLPRPALPLQKRFAQLADQLQSIVQQQSAGSLNADSIFNALLARAFSGVRLECPPALPLPIR